MMIKNDDGSFSPVGKLSQIKEGTGLYNPDSFFANLSEDSTIIIKSEDRYVQNYVITNRKPLMFSRFFLQQ